MIAKVLGWLGFGSHGHGGVYRRCPPSTQNILVLCSTHRDHRELPRLCRSNTQYLFHDYASTSLEELIVERATNGEGVADPFLELGRILAEREEIAAIVSTDDYPGSALAAAAAKELGLPGPEPAVSLICQHKYLSRIMQSKHVPEAVPPFALIDVTDAGSIPGELSFPVFVKPVKSFFSIGAGTIASQAELAAMKSHWTRLDGFFLPLERMLQRYAGTSIGTKRLIAERLLRGEQATVEGYAYRGDVSILGVVDSVMFPGTLAFSRFEYPSALAETVQERMADIARTFVRGIGFDNGMFNIEMMYDAQNDRLGIIEINPRMASQFADLYEKVDGTNAYEILLDIATGRQPQPKYRQGAHRFAASCVLRTFEDRRVAALPSDAELERLALNYPDIRVEIHATLGRKLSDDLQDGHSYRYGIINLGGRDRDDVLEGFEACRARLGISLLPLPVGSSPPQ